jgi:8-hydroxy-5-deazaflavin:NADPH oxidoreductase
MSIERIGIIGSGRLGAGLARLAVANGIEVVIANSRGPASVDPIIAELGAAARAVATVEASECVDLVILAVPLTAYSELPAEALAGLVVVDASNYYPQRSGTIEALEIAGVPSSVWVQQQWPDVRLVKALNTVDFVRLPQLARPADAADRTALPVAADDPAAKATVCQLLDVIGFDALDAGTLADSWRFQPGTPTHVDPYLRYDAAAGQDPAGAFLHAAAVPVPRARAQALLADA